MATGGDIRGDRRAPRTILYTGKGGVGKTSLAAATARRCAEHGLRTVVLSTDPAHSLSDSLGVKLGPDPTPIAANLWGQEVQAQRELEANWAEVRRWLTEFLTERGVMDVTAEELTVPPGMDELFSLMQIKTHHASGEFDAVIVDCAPTGETLRLLSFPDILRWWLERVVPVEGRILAAARPVARTLLDVNLPSDETLDEVQRLVRNLIALNEILRDSERASIRLVMNADRMVIHEARRMFTYLGLYGYLTDAVIVNRLFPEEVAGGYFGPWRERQTAALEEVRHGFAPVPILTARYFDEEVMGDEMLDRLADEAFAGHEPHAMLHDELPHEVSENGGATELRIRAPFAEKGELRLRKVDSELVIDVGTQKRTIILPSALARREPTRASLDDGVLTITFNDERSRRHEPGAARPPHRPDPEPAGR
jgi:arsenite-transporting ATPase